MSWALPWPNRGSCMSKSSRLRIPRAWLATHLPPGLRESPGDFRYFFLFANFNGNETG